MHLNNSQILALTRILIYKVRSSLWGQLVLHHCLHWRHSKSVLLGFTTCVVKLEPLFGPTRTGVLVKIVINLFYQMTRRDVSKVVQLKYILCREPRDPQRCSTPPVVCFWVLDCHCCICIYATCSEDEQMLWEKAVAPGYMAVWC